MALSDFGNPVPEDGDAFTACLIDADDAFRQGGMVFVEPGRGGCLHGCWDPTKTGFRYKLQKFGIDREG